jgi:hypothetical protein
VKGIFNFCCNEKILTEIRVNNPKKFTFFSGYPFNVDKKLGLAGFCDFVFSKKYNTVFIESQTF